MTHVELYGLTGVLLFCMGTHGLMARRHLLRKAMALNLAGGGVFLFVVAMAQRATEGQPDPVPHAMVLTGIVVAVSATAVLLVLVTRLHEATGRTDLEPGDGVEAP